MTDWGAHHMDIAQWAIGELPISVDGHAELPTIPDGFNVAVTYRATYRYASGVELTVSDRGRNGILFTGALGSLFVNRGSISGKPVELLSDNALPRDAFTLYAHDDLKQPLRAGKLDAIVSHMENFFDCVRSRHAPISDVESQHRSATTCHLGNISMRLGRPLSWDPRHEQFVGDEEADRWLHREPRKGFEIAG
jgi:hypothetical protein